MSFTLPPFGGRRGVGGSRGRRGGKENIPRLQKTVAATVSGLLPAAVCRDTQGEGKVSQIPVTSCQRLGWI